jgi:hypothetical protein
LYASGSVVVGEQNCAVLAVGGPHAAAELDQVLVGVDHRTFGGLPLVVVAARVERDPAAAVLASLADLAPCETGMLAVVVPVWWLGLSAA